MLMDDLVRLFNERVNRIPTARGCREWRGSISTRGYGVITWRRKPARASFLAHRVSYAIHHGLSIEEVPPYLRHTCDNPRCCEPAHLIPGTHAENMRDMKERRRARNGSAKITRQDAAKIRRAAAKGRMLKDLAEHYGIAPCSVSQIVSGKKWRTS